MGTTVIKYYAFLSLCFLVISARAQETPDSPTPISEIKKQVNGLFYNVITEKVYDHEADVWILGKAYSRNNKRLFSYVVSSTKDKKIYSKGKMEVLGSLIVITERFYQYNPEGDFKIRFLCQEKNGEIKLQEAKTFLKGKIVSEYKQ